MNKKLIALTVTAVGVVTPATASTDNNVSLYGVAAVSFDRINTGKSNEDTLNLISSNASRLGFRGKEDLGDGLSAKWQIESSINLDSGNGILAKRNTFVGLTSQTLGTLFLGLHDTPYKTGTAKLDIFINTLGDANSIMGNLGGDTDAATGKKSGVVFDNRLGNVIAYTSPTWNDFHFSVATVTANEEGNGAAPDGKAYSASGVFSQGPLFASLSWEKANSTDFTNPPTNTRLNSASAPATGANNSISAAKLGLGYSLETLKFSFIYEKTSASSGLKNIGYERSAYYLAATYKIVDQTSLKAAYTKASDGDSTADTSAKQATIGVQHNLSKRTHLFALYTKLVNKAGASYGIGGQSAGGTYIPSTGDDTSALSIGITHSF